MGVLGDFFLAAADDVPAYDFEAWAEEDRVESKSVTALEAAELLAILRDEPDGVPLMNQLPLLTDDDADEWIFGLPEDFAERLTSLDDAGIRRVGEAFASRTEEELGWPADEAVAFVEELRDLARRGSETGRVVFLWSSL